LDVKGDVSVIGKEDREYSDVVKEGTGVIGLTGEDFGLTSARDTSWSWAERLRISVL
jgi:hypothetical protein